MKKIILPLLFIFSVSCVPQAGPVPDFKKSKIEFKGNISSLDKVEVVVKDINCVNTKPCLNETFTLDKNNISNGISTIPGNKNIIVRQIKDGKVINEINISEEILLNQVFNIDISKVEDVIQSPIPDSSPTVTPIPTPTLTPEISSSPTSLPTDSSTPSPEPSPTPTDYVSSGGGGGGTAPVPQIVVSATVTPDELGVK